MVDSLSVEVLRGDEGGEVERSASLIRSVEHCIILALVRKNLKQFRDLVTRHYPLSVVQ
jgi:hypothetical protein